MCVDIQAISPGEVITEFRPRFEQKTNPKEAIDSVYKQFDFEVSSIILVYHYKYIISRHTVIFHGVLI